MTGTIKNRTDYSSMQSARTTTFINDYYELSREPLNLREVGQAWFRDVYLRHLSPQAKCGLVLGGTPWLGADLRRTLNKTIIVDIAHEMLQTAKQKIDVQATSDSRDVEYLCSNWLDLPELGRPVDVVAGDNCLTFLTYPTGWTHLFDSLLPKMSPDGQIIIRIAAIPSAHKATSIADIVRKYGESDSLNLTEVRAHLLFSYWRPELNAIQTEEVLEIFEKRIAEFSPILSRAGERNDLLAIRKFRDTGFVLFAPRLEEVLAFLEGFFSVEEICYGAYGLAEYFPLIVARKKKRWS